MHEKWHQKFLWIILTGLSKMKCEKTGASKTDVKNKWKFEHLKVDPCVKSLTLKRKRWLTPSNPRNKNRRWCHDYQIFYKFWIFTKAVSCSSIWNRLYSFYFLSVYIYIDYSICYVLIYPLLILVEFPSLVMYQYLLLKYIYIQFTPGLSNTAISKYRLHIKYSSGTFPIHSLTPVISNYWYLNVSFLDQKIYFELSTLTLRYRGWLYTAV